MSTLSTHVLDTSTGEPAAGMTVHLSRSREHGWEDVATLTTDDDGRASGGGELAAGTYRLGFETGDYGNEFYPFVHVAFTVDENREHYHVPLLISPYGYSTYRGS